MRVENWRDELLAVVDSAHGKRFRWGQHDCCQFAASCVRAITGNDKRLMFPRYRTRKEAQAILADLGGMRELVTKALGEPVPKSFVGEGDIVLIDMGMGPQPALCRGLNSYAPGKNHLISRPTLEALAAWII